MEVKNQLPEALTRLGCVLQYHPPEDDTPLPWAVYVPLGDDEDIAGAGATAELAIADACATVVGWEVYEAIQAGAR